MTSLRTFAKWAGWGEVLADYTPPRQAPPVPHPLPEGMDGVRRMIEVADRDNYKALVALCGMAGLRIHEALAAKASHLNTQTMMLRVLGKGEKVRYIPVSDELWSVIAPAVVDSMAAGDAPMVGLHDRAARKVITRLGEKAKLKRHVKSHDLRMTFGTAVHDATLNIRLVQDLLGHTSVETTQIYTGTHQDEMRAAVSKI